MDLRKHPVWKAFKKHIRAQKRRIPSTKFEIMQALSEAGMLKAFRDFPLDNQGCGMAGRTTKQDLLQKLRDHDEIDPAAWARANKSQMCVMLRALQDPRKDPPFFAAFMTKKPRRQRPHRPSPPAKQYRRLRRPPRVQRPADRDVIAPRAKPKRRGHRSPPPGPRRQDGKGKIPLRAMPEFTRDERALLNTQGFVARPVSSRRKWLYFSPAYQRGLQRVTGKKLGSLQLPFNASVQTLEELKGASSKSARDKSDCEFVNQNELKQSLLWMKTPPAEVKQIIQKIQKTQKFPLDIEITNVELQSRLRQRVLVPERFPQHVLRWKVCGFLDRGLHGLVLWMKGPTDKDKKEAKRAVKFFERKPDIMFNDGKSEYRIGHYAEKANIGAGVWEYFGSKNYEMICAKPVEKSLWQLLHCALGHPDREIILQSIGVFLKSLVANLKALNVTHGDLHAKNIMFVFDSKEKEYKVKLIDFGQTLTLCFVKDWDLTIFVQHFVKAFREHPIFVQQMLNELPPSVRYSDAKEAEDRIRTMAMSTWPALVRLHSRERIPAEVLRSAQPQPDLEVNMHPDVAAGLEKPSQGENKTKDARQRHALSTTFPEFVLGMATFKNVGEAVAWVTHRETKNRHMARFGTELQREQDLATYFERMNMGAEAEFRIVPSSQRGEYAYVAVTKQPVVATLFQAYFAHLEYFSASKGKREKTKFVRHLLHKSKRLVAALHRADACHGRLHHIKSSVLVQKNSRGKYVLKLWNYGLSSWRTAWPADSGFDSLWRKATALLTADAYSSKVKELDETYLVPYFQILRSKYLNSREFFRPRPVPDLYLPGMAAYVFCTDRRETKTSGVYWTLIPDEFAAAAAFLLDETKDETMLKLSQKFVYPFSSFEMSYMLVEWLKNVASVELARNSLVVSAHEANKEAVSLVCTNTDSKQYFELCLRSEKNRSTQNDVKTERAVLGAAQRAGITGEHTFSGSKTSKFAVSQSFPWIKSLPQAWRQYRNKPAKLTALAKGVHQVWQRLQQHGLTHGSFVPHNIVLVEKKKRTFAVQLINFRYAMAGKLVKGYDVDTWRRTTDHDPLVPRVFRSKLAKLWPELASSDSPDNVWRRFESARQKYTSSSRSS